MVIVRTNRSLVSNNSSIIFQILVPITHVQMEVYALKIMELPFVTAHLASQEAIVKIKVKMINMSIGFHLLYNRLVQNHHPVKFCKLCQNIARFQIFVPLSNAPMAVRVWKLMKDLLVTVLLASLEVIAKRQVRQIKR